MYPLTNDATDMSILSTLVREITYMHLFAEHDYLKDFDAQHRSRDRLPPIIGDLEPSSVIESTETQKHFFC